MVTKNSLLLGAISCLTASSLLGCMAEGDWSEEDSDGSGIEVAEQDFTASAIHEIRAQHSGKCLDVSGSNTADGTNIQQWNCNSSNAQRFKLEPRSGGFYRLVAQNSNKCVDISGSGTADGVNVQLWTCNGSGAQDFRLDPFNGRHRIINRNSNKCLDVAWASGADGANVAQVTCNGNTAQSWALTAMGGGGGSGGTPGTGGGVTGKIGDGAVSISGRQIRVGGSPIEMRGVCYNPVTKGGTHPQNLNFAGFIDRDIPLLKAAGVNVIRTYEPIWDRGVLDKLHAAGIKVAMTVYSWGGSDAGSVLNPVNSLKNHPAILMWLVGNEWNYNGLYVGLSFEASRSRLEQAAALIQGADSAHPVATVYGDLPSAAVVNSMPSIDIWGINSYRGYSFGNLFDAWSGVSEKPMFLAEYGADAWDSRQNGVNLQAQADATRNLATEIKNKSVLKGGVASGGTIFEWADEWWKDGNGSPWNQDAGGIAPGGGPHPDGVFNEEWWGIVSIDRQTRPAYEALKAVYTGG